MTKEEIRELLFNPVQVRDCDDDEWIDADELLGYNELVTHKYVVLIKEGDIVRYDDFRQMRPKPKKKWIDWTPETAPKPCVLRRMNLELGCFEYITFDIYGNWLCSCKANGDGKSAIQLSFDYINRENSEWETHDGKRCGVEVSE